MELKNITLDMLEPLVIGGSILGGGGGGHISEGLRIGKLAFEVGRPSVIALEDLSEKDTIVTVSAVGAPAAKDQFVYPMDYVECIQTLEQVTGPISAMITNENGGLATINGLFQSAVTGIPIVDAACNGRAHPTGVMGAMQLNNDKGYISHQTATGGEPGTDFRITETVKGSLNTCSHMIREASIQAGGLVAVARNPVKYPYLKAHGAINAISQAYDVGMAHSKGNTPEEKMNNVADLLKGEIILEGVVELLEFKTINGFDLGKVTVTGSDGSMEFTIWNEYMTCEDSKGNRIATFPDLLMTFDSNTGNPLTSAEIKKGQRISLLYASNEQLILGSGMYMKSNYDVVEKVIGKDIVKYIDHLFH